MIDPARNNPSGGEESIRTPAPYDIPVNSHPRARIVLVWRHSNSCGSWKDERINSVPGEPCYRKVCGYEVHVEAEAGTDWMGAANWQEPPREDWQGWRGVALTLARMIAKDDGKVRRWLGECRD